MAEPGGVLRPVRPAGPAPAAAGLAADPAKVARLRRDIAARGLEVVTLNGFPYRSFHAPVVKRAVYQPDWLTTERLEYTADLTRVLAGLLPDDAARGSVSTLPLGWRTPWTSWHSSVARGRLAELASRLAEVHAGTGRLVRVAVEPEPGCVIESTTQAVAELSGVDTRYIGVCLDLAHLACAWEEPGPALARLAGAGLPVVKVQVSAALAATRPGEPAAVADHQVAHVYVADPSDLAAARKVCAELPGVASLLDGAGKAACGLDHPRAGELVLVAEPDAWFTYYYWLDDQRAPDFARLVEIHRKPGYDPAELFLDPAAPAAARRRAAVALARKKLGMRYLMNVVGLDAGALAVGGSHGRLPAGPADGPVLLCSDRRARRGRCAATEVKDLLLEMAGLFRS